VGGDSAVGHRNHVRGGQSVFARKGGKIGDLSDALSIGIDKSFVRFHIVANAHTVFMRPAFMRF
jgi:hypothetical protein